MIFPKSFIEEVKDRVSVSEIVGRKVQLKNKGREFSGLCPFHNEKTPSFTVNDEKGFYHCFGCGAHGNAFDFLMRTEGATFPEAIERLAMEAGMQLPKPDPKYAAQYDKHSKLVKCAEAACNWFQENLKSSIGHEARDYLKGRGISQQITSEFRLGFMPDNKGAMQKALESKGFTLKEMQEIGLIKNGYEYFRGRVIFPITNAKGQPIAFGGRILGSGEPKYLNSPETEIFHKRKTLFGKAIARKPAYEAGGEIIVCEGYMDVIALNAAGFKNAVAPLGTSLTEEHLQELWKMAKEPALCFDGDRAGQGAALRAANLAVTMLKAGQSLKFVQLPAGQDPDDIVKSDKGMFANLVQNAKPLSEILYESEKNKSPITTPEQEADFKQRLNNLASQIPDSSVANNYRSFFNDKLWQDSKKSGKSQKTSRLSSNIISITPEAAEKKRLLELECAAIGVISVAPELLNNSQIEEILAEINFSELEIDKLRQNILNSSSLNENLEEITGEIQKEIANLDIKLQKYIELGVGLTQRMGSKAAWHNILEQLMEHNIKAEQKTLAVTSEEDFSVLRQKFSELVESQEKINAED